MLVATVNFGGDMSVGRFHCPFVGLSGCQCELLLLRACTGISKLYFAMRTFPPSVFELAQRYFDVAIRFALERIVTASRPGFGDWKWRIATLPFAFGGLGVYSAGDVLNYAFLASRLQYVGLQTKLLRHTGIVASGPTFDDALSVFTTSMEADLLSNPSEIAAPKLMKKMADICFTRLAQGFFDIYGDHVVSCAGTIVDMLLYSWDGGFDVCMDLTGSSPLTKTGMADFVPGCAVIDAAQCKRVKNMAMFKMSRDVLTVGCTMRIPLLYRGEYSQWVERFMNYLEEQTNEEAMINLIKNGDQPLPRVTQVSITGTTSTEQPPLKDKSMWSA
nr:hypothetical protein [Tanacetum cinerariifolium]